MKRHNFIDGLPVVDATEPLVLNVEKQDIDQRARRDPECCALSEAAKRELGAPRALVYLSRLYLLQGDCWVCYQLPDYARAEVKAFDRGAGFQTGAYRVIPPQRRDQAGAWQYRYGPRTAGGKKRSEVKPFRQVEGVRVKSPLHGGQNSR